MLMKEKNKKHKSKVLFVSKCSQNREGERNYKKKIKFKVVEDIRKDCESVAVVICLFQCCHKVEKSCHKVVKQPLSVNITTNKYCIIYLLF